MTKCNFKSLLKQYTIFYLIYLFITKFVEFKNIINE